LVVTTPSVYIAPVLAVTVPIFASDRVTSWL